MLRLKGIKKTYESGELKVHALKGIDIEFRKNEFVSVLGPSGCGKTTLLNIIGGLDRYTTGDLIINGKSTKNFKDKDWDNYRNHSVGFVFQTYNLIPHQTVLANVELALTLSGVSKAERRKKAAEVLAKVGLKDKLNSKPNQLSGGQMQRVAIARALVNDPDIILADEPTGALDSATSVQIMEILKEISKDKLIVMVTHNPELAETYSTRIVKLLDGELLSDSNPMTDEEVENEKPLLSIAEDSKLNKKQLKQKYRKKRMSYWTALSLSFKNLLTKKGRTILVAVAGSIGIIGIALILAISSGFSTYVNKMQEDTLSTYPITIEAKSIDLTTIMMQMFMTQADDNNGGAHDGDGAYTDNSISKIIDNVGNNLKTNNLTKFYAYINEHYDEIKDDVNAVQYSYDIGLSFFTEDKDNVQPYSSSLYDMIMMYAFRFFEHKTGTVILDNGDLTYTIKVSDNVDYTYMDSYTEMLDIENALKQYGEVTLSDTQINQIISALMGGMNMNQYKYINSSAFYEMIDNEKLIREQYDLVAGEYANGADEVYLVLDKNNEVADYVLYALGLITKEEMNESMKALVMKTDNSVKVNYDKIVGKKYYVLAKNDNYIEVSGSYTDASNYMVMMPGKYNPTKYLEHIDSTISSNTKQVKIAGVLRLKDTCEAGSLASGVAYSKKLTEEMIAYYNNDPLVQTHTFVDGRELKEIQLDTPSSIYIYVNTFEAKDSIKAFVDKYNEFAEQGDEISYSDIVGTIMSAVSTIINAITYVLIAFVSVSLVVSSIMIGIITYISVIERTKEIGILRSIGASKKDIKRVFNAESFIIGLSSGLFGIFITLLFTIPINIILMVFTGMGGIASLPMLGAIILVIISVILTLIAGFIPARIAAKKDPVVALRTE